MLKVRVIPVLLLKNGRMVKPVQFGAGGERDVGLPQTTARIYDSQDADDLIFLDLDATREGRTFLLDTLRDVGKNCFVPLTVGGGVRSIDDFVQILRAGADKISINTVALERPQLIREAAEKFGSQCVVVSIDVRLLGGTYEVFGRGGRERTGRDAVSWAKEVVSYGAGEILLTSIDREGTMKGYDIDLVRAVAGAVSVPVIANGGAGTRQDFADVIQRGGAHAAAASSLFHFSDSNITQIKSFLLNAGVPVRSL